MAAKDSGRRQAERDVLGDGQIVEQREMLEHHADAERARLRRPGQHDLLAHPAQFARRRLHEAVHDLDQRRLAGAVLAEQRVDFAGEEFDVDGIVGEERAVALGDADSLQQRFSPAHRESKPACLIIGAATEIAAARTLSTVQRITGGAQSLFSATAQMRRFCIGAKFRCLIAGQGIFQSARCILPKIFAAGPCGVCKKPSILRASFTTLNKASGQQIRPSNLNVQCASAAIPPIKTAISARILGFFRTGIACFAFVTNKKLLSRSVKHVGGIPCTDRQ